MSVKLAPRPSPRALAHPGPHSLPQHSQPRASLTARSARSARSALTGRPAPRSTHSSRIAHSPLRSPSSAQHSQLAHRSQPAQPNVCRDLCSFEPIALTSLQRVKPWLKQACALRADGQLAGPRFHRHTPGGIQAGISSHFDDSQGRCTQFLSTSRWPVNRQNCPRLA